MLVLTYVGGLGAIVMTTLEIRHLAVFFPALFLVASAPFAMGREIWPLLRSASGFWFGGLFALHGVWALLKFVL
jgi:hypothetical protein